MTKQTLSVVLASLFSLHSGLGVEARPGSQEKISVKPTVAELVLEMPTGTPVEVRLENKKRLRGKLGEVTDEGFVVQVARGNKVETQNLTFDQVKSLKKIQERQAARTAGYIVVGALAGLGALLLILLAVYAGG